MGNDKKWVTCLGFGLLVVTAQACDTDEKEKIATQVAALW